MPPADRDFQWLAGPDLYRQLTQPGAHAAGQPDRDLAQRSTKMLGIQLMMKTDESVKQEDVARARLFS
jgi:hypothetical protein